MNHAAIVSIRIVLASAAFVSTASFDPPAALAEPAAGATFAARDAVAPGPDASRVRPSPMFPGSGRVSAALATGIPFAAIGEVGVGVTDRGSLSAIGGVADTMDEYALGVRARASLYREGAVDVVLGLPILYYPPTAKRGDDSWILTNPSLVVSGSVGRVGFYGGLGALLASCVDDLGEFLQGESSDETMGGRPMVNGVWDTLHAGGSFRVSASTDLFLESSLMLSGFEPSTTYAERIGPPFLVQLGARTVF